MGHHALNPSADTLNKALNRLHIQRSARRLHRLGERAVYEFLAELIEDADVAPVVLAKLDAYAAVNPAAVNAVLDRYCGGRSFPPVLVQVPA
jgi:Mlc titration factor MtfA (ptsG expression regulator)